MATTTLRTTLPDELIAAARRGEMKKMTKWLRKGSVDAQRLSDGNTLLHSAVINEQPDLVRELVRRGATVDMPNDEGSTALMAACEVGALHEVRLLLEHSADANRRTACGSTALMSAAGHGWPEVVAALLEAGAEVNAQTAVGETALMTAAVAGADECTLLLLDAGASKEQQNLAGQTALGCAVAHKPKSTVSTQLLLQRAAPIAPESTLVEARALAPSELVSDAVAALCSLTAEGKMEVGRASPELAPSEVRIRTSGGELVTVPERALHPQGPCRRTECNADGSTQERIRDRRSLYRASGILARAVRDD